MTQDEIIALAREANLNIRGYYDESGSTLAELERYTALVEQATLERCAKVCEDYQDTFCGNAMAEAIRSMK